MFIVTSAAVYKTASPTSKGWLHVQHHTGPEPVSYSRTGSDFSKRSMSPLPRKRTSSSSDRLRRRLEQVAGQPRWRSLFDKLSNQPLCRGLDLDVVLGRSG